MRMETDHLIDALEIASPRLFTSISTLWVPAFFHNVAKAHDEGLGRVRER